MKNGVSNANVKKKKKKGFDNDKPKNRFSRASITFFFLVLSLAVGHCTTTR